MAKKKQNNKNIKAIREKEQELKKIYTKKFTCQLKKIMVSFKGKEEKKFYNQIYTDLNISKTAFHNYTTDRLPKQMETIFLIKDYFNVPFSYLFGETNTLKEENINISTKIGLNDNSIKVLENITKKIQNNDEDKNNKENLKLHIINALLANDNLLEILTNILHTMEEISKSENIKEPEEILFLKFQATNEIIKFLDSEILKWNIMHKNREKHTINKEQTKKQTSSKKKH